MCVAAAFCEFVACDNFADKQRKLENSQECVLNLQSSQLGPWLGVMCFVACGCAKIVTVCEGAQGQLEEGAFAKLLQRQAPRTSPPCPSAHPSSCICPQASRCPAAAMRSEQAWQRVRPTHVLECWRGVRAALEVWMGCWCSACCNSNWYRQHAKPSP